jgi:hypothetical protein
MQASDARRGGFGKATCCYDPHHRVASWDTRLGRKFRFAEHEPPIEEITAFQIALNSLALSCNHWPSCMFLHLQILKHPREDFGRL